MKKPPKTVRLSKEFDKANRPIPNRRDSFAKTTVVRKPAPPKRRKRDIDYDDVLDEFWL